MCKENIRAEPGVQMSQPQRKTQTPSFWTTPLLLLQFSLTLDFSSDQKMNKIIRKIYCRCRWSQNVQVPMDQHANTIIPEDVDLVQRKSDSIELQDRRSIDRRPVTILPHRTHSHARTSHSQEMEERMSISVERALQIPMHWMVTMVNYPELSSWCQISLRWWSCWMRPSLINLLLY